MLSFEPLQSEEAALPERLSMIPDGSTIRGVPFQGVNSCLVSHVGEEATAAIRDAVELESSFSVMTKYPLEKLLRFEQRAMAALAGHIGTHNGAVWMCGAAAIEIFFSTLAGRTMKALAGNNPHRLLASVPNGYQLLASFGDRTYAKTGENSGTFTFSNDYLGPVHTAGIFDAAFNEMLGLRPSYELEVDDPVNWRFHMSW